MKKVSQAVDDILLDYLDGNLNTVDKSKVEDQLRTNRDWQTRLDELRGVMDILSENKLEQPSKNFTSTVMKNLDHYPLQQGSSIWGGILLLAGLLVAVGMAIVLVSYGAFDNTTTSIDLNEVALSKKFIKNPLPSFEFSNKMLVNIIIVLNLGLAWILLDRTILKPLFQRRFQRQH
jgi:hypothetical protein